MKLVLIIIFFIQLLPAQIYSTIETANPNENAFRINGFQLRTEYPIKVLPITLKISTIYDETRLSDNAILSIPLYYFFSRLEHHMSLEFQDIILIPLLVLTIPVIYSNVKYEGKLLGGFGFKTGFNTDYYDTFKWDWKTQSEFLFGFYYDYGNLHTSLSYNDVITNRLRRDFSSYIAISIGYRWND